MLCYASGPCSSSQKSPGNLVCFEDYSNLVTVAVQAVEARGWLNSDPLIIALPPQLLSLLEFFIFSGAADDCGLGCKDELVHTLFQLLHRVLLPISPPVAVAAALTRYCENSASFVIASCAPALALQLVDGAHFDHQAGIDCLPPAQPASVKAQYLQCIVKISQALLASCQLQLLQVLAADLCDMPEYVDALQNADCLQMQCSGVGCVAALALPDPGHSDTIRAFKRDVLPKLIAQLVEDISRAAVAVPCTGKAASAHGVVPHVVQELLCLYTAFPRAASYTHIGRAEVTATLFRGIFQVR